MEKKIPPKEYLESFNLVMKEPDEYTTVLTEFIGKDLHEILQDYPDCRVLQIDCDTSFLFQIEIEEEEGTKILYLESCKCKQALFFSNK